jgi:cytochrome c oxidase subunit 3
MSPTAVAPEIGAPPQAGEGRGGFDDPGQGDGDGGRHQPAARYDPYDTLSWVLLIPVVMLFVGLTSSLVVRRGLSDDWEAIRIPPILFWNTGVLISSSVALELARRAMRSDPARFRTRLWITAGLGTVFLAGQVAAWRQLAAQGLFLATNPASSFFYVLTATHGAHLAGGLTALLYLTARALRGELGPRRQSALRATAVYWHFMDLLWVYLLFVLLFWR